MKNSKDCTVEMLREFWDATMGAGDDLYLYLHGERHEPDGAPTVLKRMLDFFQGDWIGLIDFDLQMSRWSTKVFYNDKTGSSTETLIAEAESFEQVARWVNAITSCEPIIIEDIENIRDSAPEEYELYKRLDTVSVLAVPYRNCNSGFMVVRNPKRFKDNYVALNIMAYVTTNEQLASQRRDNVLRRAAADIELNDNQIKLNLFGQMQIQGADFVISSEDISSDLMCRLIALLAMSKGKGFNNNVLNEKLGVDKTPGAWKSLMYKFRKMWKEVSCRDDEDFQLIVSGAKGYTINPKLEVIVDVEVAEKMMRTIDDTSSENAKIELLKKFRAMYRGELMAQECADEGFIMEQRLFYKQKYIEKNSELISLLYNQGDYTSAEKYALDAIKAFPQSVELCAWLIACMKKLGKIEAAKTALEAGAKLFDAEEFEMLRAKLDAIAVAAAAERIIKVGICRNVSVRRRTVCKH